MHLRILPFLLLVPVLSAQNPDARIQRIAEAGRLWGRLKWVHPALAAGKVDWDKCLVDALPELGAADTEPAQKSALRKLLTPLNDPALSIGPKIAPAFVKVDSKQPLVEWLPGEVALLHFDSPPTSWDSAFGKTVEEALTATGRAKALVVDLRPSREGTSPDDLLGALLTTTVANPVAIPGPRFLFTNGYAPQSDSTSGDYYTAWMTRGTKALVPVAKPHSLPMAFITNRWSGIPQTVMALQKAGLAYVIAEGQPNAAWVAPVEAVTFGTLEVTFSAGEIIFPDGTAGIGADQVVAPSIEVNPGTECVKAAIALLSSKARPGTSITWQRLNPLPSWKPDKVYPEMTCPDLPWRQLAVIRFWTVMDAFFPYKDLMDKQWDGALPEFLTRMEAVKDARGYAMTLAEMATLLQDNHVTIRSTELRKALGEAALPIKVRMVQGRVLVEAVPDPKAVEGLNRWDEVLEIDGEPVAVAIRRLSAYIPAANEWTQIRNVFWRGLGYGQVGSTAHLKVRGANQLIRIVDVPRAKTGTLSPFVLRDGEIVRILDGNIGYADLARLEPSQVDDLFLRVKDTKALIFDMRGYPKQTAWPIAPYLNVKKARVAAQFSPCIIQGGNIDEDTPRKTFLQLLPEGRGKPLYRGKVIMLINEDTQSQAEHTGLFFESACDLTYVGSPSAGSNGDVTHLILPGSIRITFTGQAVRHADGRQLQRVGLQPDVAISPTLEGLRSGRDEVLERAIQFVQRNK